MPGVINSEMENSSIILQELREISVPLANIEKKNVYLVAPAYFNALAEEILHKIKTNAERDYNFTTAIPYKVEEGYFDNLSNNILQKIKASSTKLNVVSEELHQIAPLLNTISKAPVYNVPSGYFDNLKVPFGDKPQAKVISLSKRIIKYAAAAVITGIVAFGSYVAMENNADTSKEQAVNVAVRNLKDEEIIDYLKTTSTNAGAAGFSSSDKLAPAHEIKQQLQEVPDDELQQYIKENSEPGEIDVDI